MSEPRITIRAIAVMVAKEFGVAVNVLTTQNRTGEVAFARQVAMYLAIEQTGKSLPQVATFFLKDHTTALHAHRKIAELIKTDAALASRIEALIDRIVAAEVRMQLPLEERAVAAARLPAPAPAPVEPVVAIPASVGALSAAVDTYLQARKRLEGDRFSAHEAPSRRVEEQALSGLRVAYHDYLAGGRAS